ncbi:zinc-dependent metalloprotease [Sphingobacterium sp. E70]|nr:zinc-dependent metalloprotease [Sphingobacterium sp. E70]ULT27128.1 zinc-dependent metalloprotease [Sphingobacterium sp. E70]
MGVVGQWYAYADHVLNNIGGIYLENAVLGDQKMHIVQYLKRSR